MTRRHFFKSLASGLFVASAPTLFLPKLVKPAWKQPRKWAPCGFKAYDIPLPAQTTFEVIERIDECGMVVGFAILEMPDESMVFERSILRHIEQNATQTVTDSE